MLIENFTWNWIYRAYLPRHPDLLAAIDYLETQYQQADIHIRTEPTCGNRRGQLHCGPIFRCLHEPRAAVRDKLGCKGNRVVLLSMGGVDLELPFVNQLQGFSDTLFLLAGQDKNQRLVDNVLLLSRTLNGKTLTFAAAAAGRMTDAETGSTWSTTSGRAVSGSLHGQRLAVKLGMLSYLRAWNTFYPNSTNPTLETSP